MSRDLPKSFRREFRTSIVNRLCFYTKPQKVKNLGKSKIVVLKITRAKAKNVGFNMQRIAYAIYQTKGNIKSYMWRYHQHIAHNYHIYHLSGKIKHELRVTSYEFKSTSYEFKSTSYEFKSTSYKFKSTS